MAEADVRGSLGSGGSAAPDPVSPALREQYQANHVIPLWESATTAFAKAGETAYHWPWTQIGPVVAETAKITAPSILERRVIMMNNPTIPNNDSECCSGLVSAGFQALMPGELARSHRHSMNAIRFVLEGEGAETIVEGKPCAMEPGDLVVTPGWTWHEHHNRGGRPTIWVDLLDVGIHRVLHTDAFQPGPTQGMTTGVPDAAFASAGFIPVVPTADGGHPGYSPVFRYAWADARRAVDAAPLNPVGAHVVRYADPVTGGAILPTLDCYLQQIDDGVTTRPARSQASVVCVVVEGEGESVIGDVRVRWTPRDVFTIPRQQIVSHSALKGPARIFMATDREIYRRLGLVDPRADPLAA